MATKRLALIGTVLLLVACEAGRADAPESLVGAKNLPASKTLNHETIMIVRGTAVDAPSGQMLRHALRPDNTLLVVLVEYGEGAGEEVVAEDRFQLTADVADRARQTLWRMRPAALRGAEWLVWPSGCEPRSTHDHGEAQIAFIAPDDKVGLFALPHRESCSNRQAAEARRLFNQVLNSFPDSPAASAFSQEN
jgi:hypothetical protein